MAVGDKAKNRFHIKIMNEELLVVGDISDEYVNKLVEHINIIGEDIASAYPRLPRKRIMGLALMNITDEYYKLKEDYQKKIEELNMLKEESGLLKKRFSKLQQDYDELLKLLEEAE